ncbi:uncharacterized protein LOC142330973 [Lycorma delicatula]|uniref:uncharacterized protein LOC142330973 n=1 Tax=Lycorma delicatula TaxID=130591 RepID=UPI003F518894
MGEPILKESCCGCTLEVGSKIIAWFNIVFLTIASLIFVIVIIIFTTVSSDNKDLPPEFRHISAAVIVVVGIILVFSLLIVVFFIVGVYKKRPGYMLPWLILTGIGLVLSVLVLLVYIFNIGINLALLQQIVTLAIRTYLFLVVYSYYQELKGGESGSRMSA